MKYKTLAWNICDCGVFGSIVELLIRVWMMVVAKGIGSCGLFMGVNGFGVWF